MVIYTELVICKVRGEMAHRASQHAAAEEGVRLWLLSDEEKKLSQKSPGRKRQMTERATGPA